MKRALAAALLGLALAPGVALADGPGTGMVAGKVTTVQGDALPGVTVTLDAGRGAQSAITGEDGGFRSHCSSPAPIA